MKGIRWFTMLAALMVMAFAKTAEAQAGRPFENSWFWGLKGGSLRFATNSEPAHTVGTFGADWVITRKTGGLYASFDKANFVSEARLADGSSGGGFRRIQLNDLRRIAIAGMVFPVRYGRLRPYGGIGFSLDLLGDAGVFADSSGTATAPDQALVQRLDDRRSQIGLLFMGGAQAELQRFAVFAQGSVVPNSSRFLIGRNPIVALQMGVRYNFGTSIDRPR